MIIPSGQVIRLIPAHRIDARLERSYSQPIPLNRATCVLRRPGSDAALTGGISFCRHCGRPMMASIVRVQLSSSAISSDRSRDALAEPDSAADEYADFFSDMPYCVQTYQRPLRHPYVYSLSAIAHSALATITRACEALPREVAGPVFGTWSSAAFPQGQPPARGPAASPGGALGRANCSLCAGAPLTIRACCRSRKRFTGGISGRSGKQRRAVFRKLLILWWAQQDSNLRLPPCEGGTLPLSYAPLRGPGDGLVGQVKINTGAGMRASGADLG
jgi:hypothetical protein